MPAPSVSQIPDGARVRIRMYRQGLGDCFLLTFWAIPNRGISSSTAVS